MAYSKEFEEWWKKWSALAVENPDKFEEERLRNIRALIDSAPDEKRKRLEGLQWRIDMVRGRHKNPLGACIEISQMMNKSMWGEGGLQDALNGLIAPHERSRCKEAIMSKKFNAEILPFQAKDKK